MPFPENIIANNYPTNQTDINELGIVANASNIRRDTNPAYTLKDNFYPAYPQFLNQAAVSAAVGPPLVIAVPAVIGPVPEAMLKLYLTLANSAVGYGRWIEYWELAMGLFIAHWASLWLQGTGAPGSPAAKVLEISHAKGLRTSESVDSLSAGYDFSSVVQDLNGWAAWKLTTYGVQFATIGRLLGKGGMGVY
jgi:hypothetical protein